MIITVTDGREISDCQKKLREILEEKLTIKGAYNFGCPGSSGRFTVNHNDNIWWFYYRWKATREYFHQNIFGFMPLHNTKCNSEVFTLTIPLQNINRRAQGDTVYDTVNKEYLFMHRGGFHRSSKKLFENCYEGRRFEVYDGDK